jgi:YfiH family protein
MNLGYARGDVDANVAENFRRMCRAAGLEGKRLVMARQRHGTDVHAVEDSAAVPEGVDGLATALSDVALVTFHADCVPVLFLDPAKRVVANSHAGWRGAVRGMAGRTVARMVERFGCSPGDILVGVGPCISCDRFEVDADVADRFREEFPDCVFPSKDRPGKFHVALADSCVSSLIRSGVPRENIEVSGLCTHGDERMFFSHRRDGESRGCMATFIALA